MKRQVGAMWLVLGLVGPVGAGDTPREPTGAGEPVDVTTAVPSADAGELQRAAAVPADGTGPQTAGRRFEVVVHEARLHRDALGTAPPVGRVVQGEVVTFVDFIDRRLRVLNVLIFDGGHWIKVRAVDGTVGWLPASTVQEVR